MREKRLCARLEYQGSDKARPEPDSTPGQSLFTGMDIVASGVAWFDPELRMTIANTANVDIKTTAAAPTKSVENPEAPAAPQSATVQTKGVVTVKLMSME
jgi:hypothetical protein